MSTYYLAHHGIKGQKWGIRRYQNLDGTLTEAGRKKLATKTTKRLLKRGALTTSTVRDPKTGDVIGVDSKILRRKGKKAAIEDAKSASRNAKNRKIESEEFDRLYKSLLMDVGSIKYDNLEEFLKSRDSIAINEAVNVFIDATGYTKKSLDSVLTDSVYYSSNKKSQSTPSKKSKSIPNKQSVEIDKLMSKNASLKSDFGGSSNMVDDPAYFEYVARTEYGLNTDDLSKYL